MWQNALSSISMLFVQDDPKLLFRVFDLLAFLMNLPRLSIAVQQVTPSFRGWSSNDLIVSTESVVRNSDRAHTGVDSLFFDAWDLRSEDSNIWGLLEWLGGWNHVQGPCQTPALAWLRGWAHQGPWTAVPTSGLSMWLGLLIAWWLSPQGERSRMKAPHSEYQRIVFFEAHGIVESDMGLNLCYLTISSWKNLGMFSPFSSASSFAHNFSELQFLIHVGKVWQNGRLTFFSFCELNNYWEIE